MPHIKLSRFGHNAPVFYTIEVRDRKGSWVRYEPHVQTPFQNPSTEAHVASWLSHQARLDGYTGIRCLAQQGAVTEERWIDDDELFDGGPSDRVPDDVREGAFVPPSWRRRL